MPRLEERTSHSEIPQIFSIYQILAITQDQVASDQVSSDSEDYTTLPADTATEAVVWISQITKKSEAESHYTPETTLRIGDSIPSAIGIQCLQPAQPAGHCPDQAQARRRTQDYPGMAQETCAWRNAGKRAARSVRTHGLGECFPAPDPI